jgi:hypothetical protein
VLFARDNEIFWGGTVAYLFHNFDLAAELWGANVNGQTWEYMYAIDEGRAFSLPVPEMNEITGDAPGNRVQGFRVLDAVKSERLARALGLNRPLHTPAVSEQQFDDAEATLVELSDEDVTDQVVLGAQRVVPVHKTRRHFTIARCMAELTDLRISDRSRRTIAIQSDDPARVIAAVRDLGLDSRPNVNVPRALRALV